MTLLEEISSYTEKGRALQVKELVSKALAEGLAPAVILNDGLLAGMSALGERFKRNEVFVPNLLVAARALGEGLEILRPLLAAGESVSRGKAVIGTVRGDRHDIGKKLVTIMLEGKGFEVTDLGVDVPAERFIEAAESANAPLICCSALLTTTVGEMGRVTQLLTERGLRDKYIVMVGGAAVDGSFAESIGVDGYTSDAASAADMAVALCKKHSKEEVN